MNEGSAREFPLLFTLRRIEIEGVFGLLALAAVKL